MIVQSPKRIITSDFEDDDKALAERLGNFLNGFIEEIHQMTVKNVNIKDNLNQAIRTITLTVNGSGIPQSSIGFQNPLKTRVSGMQVIRAFGATPPIAQPFISFTEGNGSVAVNHVAGLVANVSYQLVVLVIGD